LFKTFWPSASEKHKNAVERAVRLAETTAAGTAGNLPAALLRTAYSANGSDVSEAATAAAETMLDARSSGDKETLIALSKAAAAAKTAQFVAAALTNAADDDTDEAAKWAAKAAEMAIRAPAGMGLSPSE